jgi:hypothetical protein
LDNRFQHTVSIGHDVIVGKSKDSKSLRSQEQVASRVTLRLFALEMLTAIDFDNQFCFVTYEVDDVRTYRRLPSKARALKTVRAQRGPMPFRCCRVCA